MTQDNYLASSIYEGTIISHLRQKKVYLSSFTITLPTNEIFPAPKQELQDRFEAWIAKLEEWCIGVGLDKEKLEGVILYRIPPTSIFVPELKQEVYFAVGSTMVCGGPMLLDHLR